MELICSTTSFSVQRLMTNPDDPYFAYEPIEDTLESLLGWLAQGSDCDLTLEDGQIALVKFFASGIMRSKTVIECNDADRDELIKALHGALGVAA
jgi:hypothetical protein